MNPTFTPEQIALLEKNTKMSRAYDNTMYLPGIVGLNNIKANDYSNVVLQALVNVPPLRDYFLREQNYMNIKIAPGDIMINLVRRFGELTRKLWNPRNFKAHVSPHEMLQAVVKCSKKKFQITEQSKNLTTQTIQFPSLTILTVEQIEIQKAIPSSTCHGCSIACTSRSTVPRTPTAASFIPRSKAR